MQGKLNAGGAGIEQLKPDIHDQFVGSIPAIYDEHLGPLLFHFSAADLARRVCMALPEARRVLEIACGTGISTQYLSDSLDAETEIVATDLNDAMLAYARENRGGLSNVTFQQADAQQLPFEDESFDAAINQFGIMFIPDKPLAMAEMARVVRPGGLVAFNVWDSLEENRVAGIAHETIASFFSDDPPDFLTVPFGSYQVDPICRLIEGAGFRQPDVQIVSARIERPDARSVARGFVEGNPGILQIQERATANPDDIITAVAEALEAAFGPAPLQIPLQEIVFLARRP